MTRPVRTKTVALQVPGGRREWNYRVHARTECVLCHNPWVEKKTTVFGVQSASPLGVNTPQLNRRCEQAGAAANQLVTWHKLGLLAWTPDVSRLPKLVDPYDESADLDRRARSYLHANCAHCHQFNAGGTANIALGHDVPLDRARLIGDRPIQGTFQIAGARIIAPGDPAGSVLYYRMSKLGGGRMPRVGSDVVDERATRLIHDWIASMPSPKTGTAAPGVANVALEDREAFAGLRHADQLSPTARVGGNRSSRVVDPGCLDAAGHDRSGSAPRIRCGARLSRSRGTVRSIEVRDLFERFIPEDERVKRLGDVVDRKAILALRGDRERGRLVFTAHAAAQCKSCHRAGEVGENVGPDLTKIGSKYNKLDLLDQILEPSRTIEPQYATYLLETKDGRVFTGLAVERTSGAVVLKDAQGKTIKVPSADIDRLVPQPRSLMPELLLRDLTAQQVADLLEFLASLR